AWSGSFKSRTGQAEPFQRGAVVEAGARRVVDVERGNAGSRLLLAQRKRIVGPQHHAVHAAGGEQVAQRRVVGDPGIEVQPLEVLARVARVVGGDQVRPHVEAMLDAANGVGEAAAAVRHAYLQRGQALE